MRTRHKAACLYFHAAPMIHRSSSARNLLLSHLKSLGFFFSLNYYNICWWFLLLCIDCTRLLAVLERRQANTLQAGEKPPLQGFIFQGLFYLRCGTRSSRSLNPQAHQYSIWLQFLRFFSTFSYWSKTQMFKVP